MTHIVEHKSTRYSWELVRHTYIVDLESEIEIHQVEISPASGNRLHGPPYPLARFFEIEIDQIQKNGITVYSFRNICPVRIDQRSDWNILNCRIRVGRPRVTGRIHALEGERETRWLYTDDFFLISLSSGDRHDLDMLLSLIIGKLNMIALSIPTGRRIRSEFENQEKYRAAMSTMFSGGIDGAFQDVPVYQQHGEMTESEIDVSAALMSAEFQDLTAVCASAEGAVPEIPARESNHAGAVAEENNLTEGNSPAILDAGPTCEGIRAVHPPETAAESTSPNEIIPEPVFETCTVAENGSPAEMIAKVAREMGTVTESTSLTGIIPEPALETGTVTESTSPAAIIAKAARESGTVTGSTSSTGIIPEPAAQTDTIEESTSPDEVIPETDTPMRAVKGSTSPAETAPENVVQIPVIPEGTIPKPTIPEETCRSCGAGISGSTKFCGSCGSAIASAVPEESVPAAKSCRSCGAEISGSTKFCGSCGTAVSSVVPEESVPAAKSCMSCGAEISGSTKFCGSCGAATGIAHAQESAPDLSRIAAGPGDESPARSRSAEPAVNLKSIKELEDLSWLTD